MNSQYVLLLGLTAIGLAPLVAGLGMLGKNRERSSVNRTLEMMERGYAGSVDVSQSKSLTVRVGTPLAAQLGSLGRALTPAGALARLQKHLDYAGNPTGWTVEKLVPMKGVSLVGCAIVLVTLALAMHVSIPILLLVLLGGAAFGFFLPDLLIYNNGIKRQDEIRKSLPDVLDTLTISVEAGQGFDAALAQVARNGTGPMVGEAARVLQEMRIGKSRSDALRAMGMRTTITELKGFASAVVQASDLGVPIADVLREQAREMRLRRRQRAEEQAQKVPIKVLFPTLFCLFPVVFVVIIGPAAINLLHSFLK